MMLLSIDQSLNCSGIFVWNDGPNIHLVKPKDKKAIAIVKIRGLIMELKRLIHRYDIQHIVVESLPYGVNSTSVRPLAALYYMIHDMCLDLDIGFSEAIITSVKKFATGKGNAKKPEMIEAFAEQAPELYKKAQELGAKKTTGMADIADAYFIGQYYKDTHEENT